MFTKFKPYIDWAPTKIRGIIHVGANDCEERDDYIANHITDEQVIWIDPLADVLEQKLKEIPTLQVLPFCLYKEQCIHSFHLSNNSHCCSLYPMNEIHTEMFPDVSMEKTMEVECFTLDKLLLEELKPQYNMLVINVNGAEIDVLKGAEDMMKTSIDFILVTSFNVPLFENGGKLSKDCQTYLETQGFHAVIQDKLNEGTSQVLYAKERIALEALAKHQEQKSIESN